MHLQPKFSPFADRSHANPLQFHLSLPLLSSLPRRQVFSLWSHIHWHHWTSQCFFHAFSSTFDTSVGPALASITTTKPLDTLLILVPSLPRRRFVVTPSEQLSLLGRSHYSGWAATCAVTIPIQILDYLSWLLSPQQLSLLTSNLSRLEVLSTAESDLSRPASIFLQESTSSSSVYCLSNLLGPCLYLVNHLLHFRYINPQLDARLPCLTSYVCKCFHIGSSFL